MRFSTNFFGTCRLPPTRRERVLERDGAPSIPRERLGPAGHEHASLRVQRIHRQHGALHRDGRFVGDGRHGRRDRRGRRAVRGRDRDVPRRLDDRPGGRAALVARALARRARDRRVLLPKALRPCAVAELVCQVPEGGPGAGPPLPVAQHRHRPSQLCPGACLSLRTVSPRCRGAARSRREPDAGTTPPSADKRVRSPSSPASPFPAADRDDNHRRSSSRSTSPRPRSSASRSASASRSR